ncbi:MAG: Gp37-like protein [Thomasclavelia sp.]|uniref:Gp37-like protein n=1 Tax=Thomasclavelia sp. TaxID=3025757 RepID=UPI00399FDED0
MEFRALDIGFELIGIINPVIVQWNRKYHECGDYAITMPKKQYTNNIKYISCDERKEVGIVNKTTVKNDGTVEIQGYFLEKVLDNAIIYPTFYGSGEITAVLKTMIEKYQVEIDDLWRLYDITTLCIGSKIDFQATGDELGMKLYEILKTQEMSYRVTYNYEEQHIYLEFYKGEDKTQASENKAYTTFSSEWGNIENPIVYVDDSNYKNYAVVAGSGEGAERINIIVDIRSSSHEGIKKLFVDDRNTTFNNKEQTLEQYKLELNQNGLEKLEDYKRIVNIDFNVIGDTFKYLTDYDLGTKCDVIINDIELAVEARIIAVYEVFKEGKHTIELEIGDKIITEYEKLRK